MDRKAAQGLYEEIHKDRPYHSGNFDDWSEKRSFAYPYRYDEGVDIIVTAEDHAPDDDWLERGQSGMPTM